LGVAPIFKQTAFKTSQDNTPNQTKPNPTGKPKPPHQTPTPNPHRYTYLFDLSLRHGYPLLLVGATGTGKTTIVMRHMLGSSSGVLATAASGAQPAGDAGLEGSPGDAGGRAAAGERLVGGAAPDKWLPVFLTLSARTTANMMQDQVRVVLAGLVVLGLLISLVRGCGGVALDPAGLKDPLIKQDLQPQTHLIPPTHPIPPTPTHSTDRRTPGQAQAGHVRAPHRQACPGVCGRPQHARERGAGPCQGL